MKKFVVIYSSPAEAMEQMANVSPEDHAKGMQLWFDWKAKFDNHIVDLGAPLVGGQSVDASGAWNGSSTAVSGYSIVQGDSAESIKLIFDGHPHLSWAPGCSIEVYECASI